MVHEAVGRKTAVARVLTGRWSRRSYITRMAAAPIPSLESSAGLQLEQIAAAGTAVEKALLADVKSKNPNTSYIELLRLFKARRRSWALVALVASGASWLLRVPLVARLLAAAQPHR
jgi:hypothetical protein